MIELVTPYIHPNAVSYLKPILYKYPFHLKIVNGRKTKRGDFRAVLPQPIITINNNLPQEQFLITLVHEIAHLYTHHQYPKAKPHGKEWKNNFQQLMLPFLNNLVFDDDLLKLLAKHFINPKATTDSDIELSIYLQNKNSTSCDDKNFIFDLSSDDIFVLNNKHFKILNKQRTRFLCLEIHTNKKYLIKGNAQVKVIKNT